MAIFLGLTHLTLLSFQHMALGFKFLFQNAAASFSLLSQCVSSLSFVKMTFKIS